VSSQGFTVLTSRCEVWQVAAEQRKVEEQGQTIQELKDLIANQQKQIDKLTAELQRMSVEVKLAKPEAVASN